MHLHVSPQDWPFVLFGTSTSMSCLCLTHGRPEGNACHLSGWKNDSKSSNSKSLAALLDLPSLANMDWCWEAGGACYKSVNNTQECVHTNFHDAWKEQAPSPRHLRWHANTSEMIINVLITSLWQEVSFSCVDHPWCQFCFLSSAVLYAYYESCWAEYTDRKRKKIMSLWNYILVSKNAYFILVFRLIAVLWKVDLGHQIT